MPGRFELRPTLEKVWHMSDNFRFMDPLPPMYRRGIIIATIVLVVGFLLPSDDAPNTPAVTREVQLDTRLQSQPPTEEQLWAQLITLQNDPSQVAPVAPEPIQEGQSEGQSQATHAQSLQPDSGIGNQWRSYRIEPGKTMAQLLRNHRLPAAGVRTMAQVGGADKPLNNLQNGQTVGIRQNASDVVTGLTIDTGNNQQVLFTHQPDSSFIRAQQMKGQPKVS